MFEKAYERVNQFHPNKVVNWETDLNERIRIMHITNKDDRKNYMIQLFNTGSFIDYKEMEG